MVKLLIVIDSLANGGAEKSLINLLSLIDYKKVQVDLALFSRGGINERFVPIEVNYLPVIGLQKASGIKGTIKYWFTKIRHSVSVRLRKVKDAHDYTIRYWSSFEKLLPTIDRQYDVAFAYAQRLPTLYVATKIQAKHKFAWMNVIVNYNDALRKFYLPFLKSFDKVVCVSNKSEQSVIDNFPELKDRTKVVYDINNPAFIKNLSREYVPFDKSDNRINILTVARLDFEYKGYDILVETCRILKEKGYNFIWRAIGDGNKEAEIRNLITEYHLEDCFELCGIYPNPYPFFAHSDIYVQTSRSEGFGLTLAEARLLGMPVVTTPYDSVDLQIKNGINGIISTFNPEDIADEIAKLIDDCDLRNAIKNNLKNDVIGNVDEFSKIEDLLYFKP